MVMEPTDFRYRDHSAPGNREDGAGFRTIPRERHMRPPPVIIGTVAGQDARQTTILESTMSVLSTMACTWVTRRLISRCDWARRSAAARGPSSRS